MSPIKTKSAMVRDCAVSMAYVLLFLYSSSVFAAIVPDIGQMVQNLSKTIPNLMELVTALAYVMGMFFMVKSIFMLKQYGEMRTMQSAHTELTTALVTLFVGAGLFYLPSAITAGITTFWAEAYPYAYADERSDPWMDVLKSVFLIIQLIGTIAFIRGLVILSKVSGGGQPGTFSRAITHMVGGVLCINLYQFLAAVFYTLGLGQI